MSNRIADLRTPIATLDQAREVFRSLALETLQQAVADARHSKAVAALAAAHERASEPRQASIKEKKELLAAWISANRQLFIKPRTIKSDLGEFGLRTASNLDVSDEPLLLEHLMEKGYTDCFETVQKLIKPAIQKRLNANEPLPGCLLNKGDTVVCSVAKTALEEAAAGIQND